MIAIPLLAALLLGAPQDSAAPAPPTSTTASTLTVTTPARHWTPEQEQQIKQKLERARIQREPARREAIRINDLAANIHSEAEARKFVDAIAEQLTHHRHLLWAAEKYRHRVAHAEYEAVSDPSGLIPEERIVDVWNEYVREIDVPEEGLITVAELHNLRDATYVSASRYMWKQESGQSIWTMPNIYALDAEGHVANGCRALETLKLIHDMHDTFINLRIARVRVQQGDWLASDNFRQNRDEPRQLPVHRISAQDVRGLGGSSQMVETASFRYKEQHGERAYDQLVRRLFDELFPPE